MLTKEVTLPAEKLLFNVVERKAIDKSSSISRELKVIETPKSKVGQSRVN